MKLMQFLSGLGDWYNQFKGHIWLIDPLPNVRNSFVIITREEFVQKKVSCLIHHPNLNQKPLIVNPMTTERKEVLIKAFNSEFNDNRKKKRS